MKFDSKEFNKMFSELRPRFTRFAESYLNDSFLAEDMYVDSMMLFWQSKDNLPQDTNVPAYVLRTLKNKCIDYLRRCRLNDAYCEQKGKAGVWDLDFRISSLSKFIPENVFKNEIEKIISNTLEEMPADTRRVFMLSRREGKSVKEISSIMGLTVKGVEYHITKVTKALRLKLKDYISI